MAKLLSDMLGAKDLSKHIKEERIDEFNQRPRLPAIFLVDTSGSMSDYEELLKRSVEALYDAILADRTASASAELSVMTFNSDIEVLEKMREIKKQEARGRNLDFHCDGVTLTGLALKVAIQQLEARKSVYENHKPSKVKYYSPIIFLISDGKPECYDATVMAQETAAMSFSKQYIKQKVGTNNLVVIAVEVGNRCDHALMTELTGLSDDRHVTKVNNASELACFFKISSSMIISSSKTGTNTLNTTSFKDMK